MWSRKLTNWLGIVIAVTLAALLIYTEVAPSHPENYTRSLFNTLVHEGGHRYTNHPADPGGPTKYGITIHDVRRYLNPRATADDVRNLREEQAKTIYRERYWDRVRGDDLPRGVDYSVFDYAVNAGYGRAIPELGRCTVGAANVVTDAMVRAARARPEAVIRCINDRRMRFQMGLGARYNVFKRGWARRINSVRAIALSMAGVDKASLGGDINLIPRQGPGKIILNVDELEQ